jgi:hypothetical protein
VLPSCAAVHEPSLERAAHGDAVPFTLAGHGFVCSVLIAMYGHGCWVRSTKLLLWRGDYIDMFDTVVANGVLPNEITLICFLPCLQGWLAAGEVVHGFVVKLGYDANM